jgi:hypothetical protein
VGMKSKPRKSPPSDTGRRMGAPESPASNETFLRRVDPPGKAGLANETRPGIGTRADEPFPGEPGPEKSDRGTEGTTLGNVAKRQHSGREPNDKALPREAQEQRPDSWAQEAERSTGVSGHSGST